MKKKIILVVILVIAIVVIVILAFGGGIGNRDGGGADGDASAEAGVQNEVQEFVNLDALVPEGFTAIDLGDDDHTVQILTDDSDNTPFIEFKKAGSGYALTEEDAKEEVLAFVKKWANSTGDDFQEYTIGGKTFYGATYTYTYTIDDAISLYLVGEGTPNGKFLINIAGATLDDPNIKAIIDSVVFK